MRSTFTYFVCVIAIAFTQTFAFAQDSNSALLKKFVTPDVLGIAYIDIENMDLDASLGMLGELGFKQTYNYQKMQEQTAAIEADIAKLKDAGLSRGYALLRMSDIQNMGTSFVMPLADGSDEKAAIDVFRGVLSRMNENLSGYNIEYRDGALIAASEAQFERLKNEVANDTTDRTEMWQAIDGGSMGVVVFGDDDSRRVVKEMMPALPGPFAKLDGDLISSGTKWIGLAATLDSKPGIKFEIETNDEESAKVFESIIKDALKMAKFAPQVRQAIPRSEIKFVFNSIAPKRNGTRVSMSASKLTKDLDRLAKVIAPQVIKLRAAAVKTQLKNTLRQHILSMLNYESAWKQFPAQYSIDDDGKPLLSWRVQVLPFLEQQELYDQFKLDEPWDSPHNIKLVEKMPQIFWDLRGESFERNKAGKTIFQVAAGEGLAFNGAKHIKFQDLSDGSSNTISLLALPGENAVPWTKPVDWNVDLQNPFEGLKGKEKRTLIVAMFDGSIMELPESFPADELRKWLQPNDGEANDYDTLK